VKLLPATAVGSAFLNNTPIVAMLVPVIEDMGRTARLSVSRIYLPVSYASVLGGTATLIGTSSNLIIAGLVLAQFDETIDVFFPFRIALPTAIVGLLFLLVLGPRLLPEQRTQAVSGRWRRYRAEFYLPPGSPLQGKTLAEAGFVDPVGSELLRVEREGAAVELDADGTLEEGDVLILQAQVDAIPQLWTKPGLAAANPREDVPGDYAHRLVEVVIARRSPLLDRRLGDLHYRHSIRKVVGVSHYGGAPESNIHDYVPRAGDNVLLQVSEEFLDEHHEEEYALLRQMSGYRIQRRDRAWAAGVIVLAMVALSAFGVMSLLNASLLAVAALIATGSISLRAAWRSIDWQTYVVLASAIALEPAVTNSGLAESISDLLTRVAGDSTVLALAAIFVGAVIVTNLVTNAAAAALMFPITVGIVTGLDVPYEPYVAVLMLGTSYAFINPAGYQTHLMVMGPGGYRTTSFARVGVPLTIVLGLVAIPLAPLLY
jgi:di/tricarboxylate transporter